MSRYSLKAYQNFTRNMAIGNETFEIDLKQRGYLFLAAEKMRPLFEKQLKLQHQNGVLSEWLGKTELVALIPELITRDLAGGLYCAESGYLEAVHGDARVYKKCETSRRGIYL